MDPITIAADPTAQAVLQDAADTLAALRVSLGPVFAYCRVFESLERFQAAVDAAAETVAGVIGGLPQQSLGTDNAEDHLVRLPFTVAVRLQSRPLPGQGNVQAMAEMNGIAPLVRQALRVDPTRGGRAMRIAYGGKYIDGTDVTGDARLVNPRKSDGFFTATIPAACGWSVNKSI